MKSGKQKKPIATIKKAMEKIVSMIGAIYARDGPLRHAVLWRQVERHSQWVIFWNHPEGWQHPVNIPTWLMDALDQIGRGQFRQDLKTINNALDAFWLKVALRFGGTS